MIKNNVLLSAALAYYEAQRAEALASLEIFLQNQDKEIFHPISI